MTVTPARSRTDVSGIFQNLLHPDDLVIFNNTRVFPARLYGRRSGGRAQPVSPRNRASREFLKGEIEILLTRQVSTDPNEWECLVRPGRKIGVGERLYFGESSELQAVVIDRGTFGERRIRFAPGVDFWQAMERWGHVPLPPYIDRADRPADRERYQTVYARERGSVAAPTAGLHFTPEVLDRIRDRGVLTAEITLHVGLGTFQPVRVDQVEDHRLHREWYSIWRRSGRKNQPRIGCGSEGGRDRNHHCADTGVFGEGLGHGCWPAAAKRIFSFTQGINSERWGRC